MLVLMNLIKNNTELNTDRAGDWCIFRALSAIQAKKINNVSFGIAQRGKIRVWLSPCGRRLRD